METPNFPGNDQSEYVLESILVALESDPAHSIDHNSHVFVKTFRFTPNLSEREQTVNEIVRLLDAYKEMQFIEVGKPMNGAYTPKEFIACYSVKSNALMFGNRTFTDSEEFETILVGLNL